MKFNELQKKFMDNNLAVDGESLEHLQIIRIVTKLY